MAQKFFKLREAEELLPLLETLLKSAITEKKKVETLEAEFVQLAQRIMIQGGLLVDHEKMVGLKVEKGNSVAALRSALEEIASRGCLIKDLDSGLVDFPCLLEQREVYLCWKLGEPHIGFWHDPDEGFAGRKPIDPGMIEGRRPN